MKISHLEICQYAPEMNRLYLKNGISFKAPGCTTIRDARRTLFPKPWPGLACWIYSEYDDPQYQWLNKLVACGQIPNRLFALRTGKDHQQQGGPLLDGRTLPPNRIRIKFYYNPPAQRKQP